jgi:hypothetical protein
MPQMDLINSQQSTGHRARNVTIRWGWVGFRLAARAFTEAIAKLCSSDCTLTADPARPLDQPAARAPPDRFLSCKSMKGRRPGSGA